MEHIEIIVFCAFFICVQAVLLFLKMNKKSRKDILTLATFAAFFPVVLTSGAGLGDSVALTIVYTTFILVAPYVWCLFCFEKLQSNFFKDSTKRLFFTLPLATVIMVLIGLAVADFPLYDFWKISTIVGILYACVGSGFAFVQFRKCDVIHKKNAALCMSLFCIPLILYFVLWLALGISVDCMCVTVSLSLLFMIEFVELVYLNTCEKINAKTSVLFDISRDTRNLMNAIIGYTSIARKNISDKARVMGCLGKVERSCELLLNQVSENIEGYTSSEGEKVTYAKSEVGRLFVSLKGRRVLLVDDNDFNREIIKDILEDAGIFVDEAENGSIAVNLLKLSWPGDYDFVLMDIQMPEMDGYTATQIIRNFQDRELAHIPIIAMTADAFEGDKRKALETGMDSYIAKPVKAEALLNILQSVMKKKGLAI